MSDLLECLLDWGRNIGWVLISFGILYLIVWDTTLAALLTIALSDLYIK